MVLCKFFLQGTCKFGDFCKFDHQLNDNFHNYQNSTSILRQSQFGNTQAQHQQLQHKPASNSQNVDVNTLVKSVVNDMVGAEKGGQWLLSCYAPFKEKPAFPGFEDHSFEEIRLGYYEAVKNGTVEQYRQQVQALLQQAVMRVKSLQSPSPDIVNLLKCIYYTPAASNSGVYGTNTVSTATSFGNATNASGAFGQQQQQQPSSFGQRPTSANMSGSFGQQQAPSFGQQSASSNIPGTFAQQQSSPFGQKSTPSVFAQSNQNLFGKPSQTQNQFSSPSGSIFGGGAPQAQANPIFGNSQTPPQNTNTNIFQQANMSFTTGQTNNSIFGGKPTAQSNSGSFFGGGQSPIFGGQQSAPSTFVSQPQIQQSGGNIFSNTFAPQNTNSTFRQNIFGGPSNVQASQAPGVTSTSPNVPQQTSTNIFGVGNNPQFQNQQSQNSIFAQQSSASIFNQNTNTFPPQSTNSPFGQIPSSITNASSHSSSIFGNSQNTTLNSPFGQVQKVDETIYSKLEELTEDEIKWFESDDLDILNLPEKPPTYQMCFKT